MKWGKGFIVGFLVLVITFIPSWFIFFSTYGGFGALLVSVIVGVIVWIVAVWWLGKREVEEASS